jgi:lipopolysaccharide transport system permease protein
MLYYGVPPSWGLFLLPAFVLLAVLAALACGIWLSALNAMYRDAGYVGSLVLQMGFFVSPVVYATGALIPERWRPVLALNPMVGAIEGLRWSLLGQGGAPGTEILVSAVMTGAVLVSGLVYFRRVEGVLADRI